VTPCVTPNARELGRCLDHRCQSRGIQDTYVGEPVQRNSDPGTRLGANPAGSDFWEPHGQTGPARGLVGGLGEGLIAGESGHGTTVWTGRALQAGCDDLETIGLALLYPALEWSGFGPGHHGYPRASDLIRDKALEGRKYIKITDATVRPFLHLLNPTRRPRQESFGFCRR
jgi:hypothetical protein